MAEMMMDWKRDMMCAEVKASHIGQCITLMGWVDNRRDFGSLIFIDLRDRSGLVQCVFDQSLIGDDFEKVATIRSEYVLAVRGTVVQRSEETVNPKLSTGTLEVKASEVRILSTAQTPPFYIEDDLRVREELRLQYRYLDLRRPAMQRNLILRSEVAMITREYLSKNGFIEIETPMLAKDAPEGAREFLVPSRVQKGAFYALPQSPQMFKQLFMVSGFDRYFQIVRCFRDEDLRADRQPEFTQIDLEMSFVQPEDVMQMNEGLIRLIFEKAWGASLPERFRRMTYREAMDRFGSDKPDTRFGLELCDIGDIVASAGFKVFSQAIQSGGTVRGINVKGGLERIARREFDALVDFVKQFGAKGMAWISVRDNELQSPLTKFFTEDEMHAILRRMDAEVGDILMLVSDANEDIVFDSLGRLRLELGERLGLIDHDRLDVLWITQFPLFEYDHEEKRLAAKHHPFTAPMDEDVEMLDTEPLKVRAKAYDLVINGMEAGGGSCRIYSQDMQKKMFSLLGYTDEEAWSKFGFLLEAFKYGTPPHGGLAFGFDRLIMILCKCASIRDVIAFPKVQSGSCLLTGAPVKVDDKQLRELHIRSVTDDR
jgi:aspartyl-tRNA synthetase